MAIPATPRNMVLQQGNGQVLISWDSSVGATSYSVQKSTDNSSFSTIPVSGVIPKYKDTSVTIGTAYYYRVAAVNGDGTSAYSSVQVVVPCAAGEMCLSELRTRSQQRADRVNSDFVTKEEWNSYINQSLLELYDILIGAYEDYFVAPPAKFLSVANTQFYDLPNGTKTFLNDSGASFVARPFYKLLGVDLGLATASNAWVSVNKFNFLDRNKFVYPNAASTIYGVFNLRYRLVGTQIEFIPTPSAGQPLRLWYIPRMESLLEDTDCSTIGFSGWLEYVIVDAAIKALQKEEADVSVLMAQKQALLKRIEESAVNRDAGQPDTISDIRGTGWWGAGSGGYGGPAPMGGF